MNVMDIYDVPLDDISVFEMISDGDTALLFQIGTNLLKKWAKKFRPRSIEELAALIAVVRPGVLNTYDDEGVSMADHICMRKQGQEPPIPLHPILERSTKSTWGTLLYQEQLLTICEDVCGWDRIKGLDLMKAVAKKNMEKILKLKTAFVEDAVTLGRVSEVDATKIYESMEASGRYLFNKAHAVEYAVMAYVTAYYKKYKKLKFFHGALKNSKSEQKPKEEIAIIYEDMNRSKFELLPPDVNLSEDNFKLENDKIRFGITNIAGIGDSNYNQLVTNLKKIEKRIGKKTSECNWYEFLINFCHKNKKLPKITLSIVVNLIEAGAFDFFGVDRKRMRYEVVSYQDLSEAEHLWCIDNHQKFDNLIDLLKGLAVPVKEGGGAKSNRIELINSVLLLFENPPMELKDTVDWIVAKERKLLGINLTASRLDKFDTKWVNARIEELNAGETLPVPSYFAVVIEAVRKTKTTKGKNPGKEMCLLMVEDDSGKTQGFSFVVFPKVYEKFVDLCDEGNAVVITGEQNGDSIFVNEMSLL